MKNQLLSLMAVSLAIVLSGCGSSKGPGTGSSNGQLIGAAYTARPNPARPYGMIKIPQGTFHMGPSDEDANYAFTSRNRQISIMGFWMDVTEITNSEYKQFVH